MLDVHLSLVFPSQGRSRKLATFSWSLLAMPGFCMKWFEVLHCCKTIPSSLLAPRHPKHTGSVTALNRVRQKTGPCEDPWKTGIVDKHSILLFPSQGRSCKLRFYSWFHRVVSAWGKCWCGWNEITFLTCFNAAVLGFELAWGTATYQLVSGILIRAFWCIYCCSSVSL